MNALDVLKYGQRTLLQNLENFPENQAELPGACGYWSVKDIIAHLASHELVLVDVLASVATHNPTPYLDNYKVDAEFNDNQVDVRKGKTLKEVVAELGDAYNQASTLAAKISPETFRQPGTIPWYGSEYSLDDYIAYASYGHKREHSAQIAAFGDIVKAKAARPQDSQTPKTIKVARQIEEAINQRDSKT